MNRQQFRYSNSIIVYPLLLVISIWLVFWYQVRIDSGIRHFGIYPQKAEGLLGVFTSPFIHSNISHLYNNSIPLLILSMALFYFYNKIAWRILFFGMLISGLLTWFIGKSGNHIGASGVIYMLVSFIFFKLMQNLLEYNVFVIIYFKRQTNLWRICEDYRLVIDKNFIHLCT